MPINGYHNRYYHIMEGKDNGPKFQLNNAPPGFEEFDPKNLSPQDKTVANTVVGCLFESIGISLGSGYLAFRQAGSYIASRGSPKMKSWGTIIKFGVGFFTFSLVRNMYGRGVCLPRVERLPPSPMREKLLAVFNSQQMPSEFQTQAPTSIGPETTPFPPRGGMFPAPAQAPQHKPQPVDPEPLDNNNETVDQHAHQNDDGGRIFDDAKSSHQTHKGKEFDYTSSRYNLPPADAPSKAVRRNKYGDIVEEA